jgi:hypothetical protein
MDLSSIGIYNAALLACSVYLPEENGTKLCGLRKKNGHISGRKTKDRENPGMKTKTWQNPFIYSDEDK